MGLPVVRKMGRGTGLEISKQGKLQAVVLALVSFQAAKDQEPFVQLVAHQILLASRFWMPPSLDPPIHLKPSLYRSQASNVQAVLAFQ